MAEADRRAWRPRPASPRAIFLLLWLLAATHRLFLQMGGVDRGWPFPVFYEGDAETFYHYALSILAGQSYDAGVPFHPPLFPAFLALLHGLLGNPAPDLLLRGILAVIHALQVPLLWLLLRRYLPPGAALAGALLAAWSYGLSLLSVAAVSEGLYLVLLLTALLLFTAVRAGGTRALPVRAAGLGVLLGLLALTRAEGLGVAAALLVWGGASAWRAPSAQASAPNVSRRRRVVPWVMAAAGLCLALAPWTIRNAVTLTRVNRTATPAGLPPLPTFVPTTAYGPLNFALANHAAAPGWFTRTLLTSGLQRGVLDLRDPQHRESFVHGYRQGWTFIRTTPGAFLRLAGRKLALLARSLRLGWLQWDLPGGLRGTRYPVDLATPDSPAAVPVHLLLLAPGIWMLAAGSGGVDRARGREWLRLTGLLGALTVLACVAFFGYARQGALLLPFLFGVEGVTLAAAASGAAARVPWLRRRPTRALAAVILAVWAVELCGAFQNRDFIATGETQAGSRMLNRDSVMHLAPK